MVLAFGLENPLLGPVSRPDPATCKCLKQEEFSEGAITMGRDPFWSVETMMPAKAFSFRVLISQVGLDDVSVLHDLPGVPFGDLLAVIEDDQSR